MTVTYATSGDGGNATPFATATLVHVPELVGVNYSSVIVAA